MRLACVRWSALVLVLGCNQDSIATSGGGDGTGRAEDGTAGAADGVTAPGPSSGANDATAADGGASGDSDPGGTGDPDGQDSDTVGDDPGPRWQQLIRSDPFPRLVIEVDYVMDREPRPQVIDDIQSVFFALLDKPDGVEVVLDEIIVSPEPDHAWTSADRSALLKETSTLVVPEDTITIHAVFVDGHAAEDDEMSGSILGYAWANENIMMFRDTIDRSCQGVLVGRLGEQLCVQTEFLVWQHEIGHVIGLVDAGLPMVVDHRDPDPRKGRHDADRDCVMFSTYEGTDAVDAIADRLTSGAAPIEFDPACIADIDAAK